MSKVTIHATLEAEVASVQKALACLDALGGKVLGLSYEGTVSAPAVEKISEKLDEPAQVNAAPAPAPTQAPVPVAPAPAPVAPVAPPPSFTLDELSRAAAALMDAGKQQDLLGLLASFGVQAMTQLPKEQYGAFADGLRQLGATV